MPAILVFVVTKEPIASCGREQTENMHDLARQSNGTLRMIHNRDELRYFIKAREEDRTKVGAILGIEGTAIFPKNRVGPCV